MCFIMILTTKPFYPFPNSHLSLRLDIVSPSFAGKTQLSRHRMVNNLLKDEMAPGLVHALQLHTRTPEEDAKRQASSA